MAIKFEFTLDDDEAERFFDLFSDEKSDLEDEIASHERCLNRCTEEAEKEKQRSYIKWYKGHLNWLMSMKEKIVKGQTRLDNPNKK